MIQAPSPTPECSAPAVTLPTLRRLVENGQQRHPALAGRMARAAEILTLRTITPEGDGYRVQSEREADKSYHVGPASCECPDFARAPRGFCKHRLAVALLTRCQQVEKLSAERVTLTPAGAAYLAGHDDGTAGRAWSAPAGHALRRHYLRGYQSAAAPAPADVPA